MFFDPPPVYDNSDANETESRKSQKNKRKAHQAFIREFMVCHMCGEMPKVETYDCTEGHHNCEACVDTQKKECSCCHAELCTKPNVLLGKLWSQTKLTCMNSGCGITFGTLDNLDEHQEVCIHRDLVCEACKKYEGTPDELYEHITHTVCGTCSWNCTDFSLSVRALVNKNSTEVGNVDMYFENVNRLRSFLVRMYVNPEGTGKICVKALTNCPLHATQLRVEVHLKDKYGTTFSFKTYPAVWSVEWKDLIADQLRHMSFPLSLLAEMTEWRIDVNCI